MNAEDEKGEIEGEVDLAKKSGSGRGQHHGQRDQKEDSGELSGREHFNRPEKDRRNNYNADIIERLSSASRGLQKEQGEP